MEMILDMQMTTGDMHALEKFIQQIRPRQAVEVGSWKGLSTSIIARHTDQLFCVDTWAAAPSTPAMAIEASQNDVFAKFRYNMIQAGVMQKICPIMGTSAKISGIVKDESMDLVFIDADHAYSSILNDINLWLPKVKPGGILSGHDLDDVYTSLTPDLQAMVHINLEKDFLPEVLSPGRGLHPGVCKAIYDIFNDQVNRLEDSSIWWIKK